MWLVYYGSDNFAVLELIAAFINLTMEHHSHKLYLMFIASRIFYK